MARASTEKTAQTLVRYCREGRTDLGLDELYAPDAVSVEAVATDGAGRESRGLDAIRAKHAWWNENFTVHDAVVEGPFPHGDDRFALIFEMETSPKNGGERSRMREIAVYGTDADGRIVREEFFYG